MRFQNVCRLIVAAGAGVALACGTEQVSSPIPPPEEFQATLSGASEIPAVTTSATGTALFAVVNDSILVYNVSVGGADSVTVSHIHEGDASVAGGPILVTLFTAATPCKLNAGGALNITSSSVANPTTITTATAHGRAVGSTALMRIAGHVGSTPSLVGEHTATFTGTTTFTIPVNVTVGGTGGTAQRFTLTNFTSTRCRPQYTGPLSQTQLKYSALPSDTLVHRRYTSYGTTARARFDSLLVRMRNGSVYVNVHNAVNPAGHIRGQIQPVP
ncbi:MAG TPA: CHRD domain-containing protein [Gemmatimonadales bacterium]|nr:CHRD domain-containing protein [Gemmatimonadales bacterium]